MALTLGFVTDLHFGRDTLFEGKLRKLCHRAPELARATVKTFDDAGVDLLVNLGDDIEDASHAADLEQYRACQAILRTSRAPIVNVAGNHDTVYLSPDELNSVWERSGPLYYSFEHGGWHFTVLHTHEHTGVNITLDRAQLEWVQRDLRAAGLPVIVLMHHSASDQDVDDSRWFSKAPQVALVAERAELRAMFEASGKVRAVFNGHLHRNHLDVIRGIPYVTLQSLIENMDDDAPGRAAGAHTIVRIDDSRIVVRVRGEDPARYQFQW